MERVGDFISSFLAYLTIDNRSLLECCDVNVLQKFKTAWRKCGYNTAPSPAPQLFSTNSLLFSTQLQRIFSSLRLPQRFWAADRTHGFWEKDVCLLWHNLGKTYPDWEDNRYLQHYRMSKDTFWYVSQTFGGDFETQT